MLGARRRHPRPAATRKRSSTARSRRCRRTSARAPRSTQVEPLRARWRSRTSASPEPCCARSASRSRSRQTVVERQAHAARRVRGGGRGDGLADVPDGAARGRPARAGARGARLRAARARARLARSGCWSRRSALAALCSFVRDAAMLVGLGAVRRRSTGRARRCGCSRWRCGASPSPRSASRSAALAREVARGVAARLPAVAAARLPRARAGRRRVAPALYDAIGVDLRRVPVQGDARRRSTPPSTTRRRLRGAARCTSPRSPSPTRRSRGRRCAASREPESRAARRSALRHLSGDGLPPTRLRRLRAHRRAARTGARDASCDAGDFVLPAVRDPRDRPARADRGDARRRAPHDRRMPSPRPARPPRSASRP